MRIQVEFDEDEFKALKSLTKVLYFWKYVSSDAAFQEVLKLGFNYLAQVVVKKIEEERAYYQR